MCLRFEDSPVRRTTAKFSGQSIMFILESCKVNPQILRALKPI